MIDHFMDHGHEDLQRWKRAVVPVHGKGCHKDKPRSEFALDHEIVSGVQESSYIDGRVHLVGVQSPVGTDHGERGVGTSCLGA